MLSGLKWQPLLLLLLLLLQGGGHHVFVLSSVK